MCVWQKDDGVLLDGSGGFVACADGSGGCSGGCCDCSGVKFESVSS